MKSEARTRGEKVCAFIETYLCQPEGDHVGQPMKLESFQRRFILDVYDNPYGTPSQWVIDLRASARYVAAFVVILGGLAAMFSELPVEVKGVALEAVSVSFGFLFGTRIVANMKK